MSQNQVLISADNQLNIKTLNNVAVEYFEMGLWDVSYQIWAELYHSIQRHSKDQSGLLPVICCNMANALRQTDYCIEAYRICRQGLKWCFGTGAVYAVPELTIQMAILCGKIGDAKKAEALYSFGKNIFHWSRQARIDETIDEIMEQDFLLYCNEEIR